MSELSCPATEGSNLIRLSTPSPRMVVAGRDHVERGAFESFVQARFAAVYGATVSVDHPYLAALRGADGEILAAAGLRFAEAEPLFLERYLDGPVELALARLFPASVTRAAIVEIGALASVDPAASLGLFDRLPAFLAGLVGRRFAVATLRPELARRLTRAGFALQPIASADPERLGPDAAAWGRYYAGRPQVYAGRIMGGAALAPMRERLRSRTLDRQFRRGAEASA